MMLLVMQIEDVYITRYETCGLYWPYIHHYIIVAIILMQVTMIGIFGLKSKPSASFSVIPLLVITILFNEYCKIRFFPTFKQVSVQVTTLFIYIFQTPSLPPPKGELQEPDPSHIRNMVQSIFGCICVSALSYTF